MQIDFSKRRGYRGLKSFHHARIVYDLTVRFCNKFVDMRSRTHDQMVQAARSGVQNIAEGCLVAPTSKSTELKLTNVARASLEELRLDYEDFLRHRRLPLWAHNDLRLSEFVSMNLRDADAAIRWIKSVAEKDGLDIQEVAANGVLALIDLSCRLLDGQLSAQAQALQDQRGWRDRRYLQFRPAAPTPKTHPLFANFTPAPFPNPPGSNE